MVLDTKNLPVYVVKSEGQPEGIVEAFVAVYGNVDSYNERIIYGAFAKSIAKRKPRVVWSHDLNRPVGKTLEIEEVPAGDARLPDEIKDFGGLRVKGAYALKTRDGADAWEHNKFGSFEEYSIGFKKTLEMLGSDGINELHEIDLYEWSPVVFGANPLTSTINVKMLSLDDKLGGVVALCEQIIPHADAFTAMKSNTALDVKKGAAISAARRAMIRAAADALIQLLDETDPAPKVDPKKQLELLGLQFSLLQVN